MTYHSQPNKPKSIYLSQNYPINLLVHGQCVFLFSTTSQKAQFFIYNKDHSDGLIVDFTDKSIWVRRISDNVYLLDPKNKVGIIDKKGAYYWFSLDSQNTQLYAGYGESRIETKQYYYKFSPDSRSFLESLVEIVFNDSITPIKLLRDPVTAKIPLYVENTNQLTMDDIAANSYMPTANLPIVCQQLYNCISGKNFVLDTPDFPDFSKAIQYSIDTPGMWCYNKLQEKSTEFNPDKPNILETYLRITLGQNNGESPGIPYVMEIWPSGHYSPIHSHSSANAIIRVLHGSINVTLYPFLCAEKTGITPFGNANFDKDEVTWISTNLNQTHMLKNIEPTDACITIQCYMYDKDDTIHYDYFDYVDEEGVIQHYNPDSDMAFLDFKKQMRLEWDNKNSNKRQCVRL